MTQFLRIFALLLAMTFGAMAHADTRYLRWEASETQLDDSFEPLLAALNQQSGLTLTAQDFTLIEERALAFSHFKYYVQLKSGVAIRGATIRTWAQPEGRRLIQLEAHLDDGHLDSARDNALKLRHLSAGNLRSALKSLNNARYIDSVLKKHEDSRIAKVEARDEWQGADLVRVIEVTARRGVHTLQVSHLNGHLISKSYERFPQADIAALVYPIYEETERNKTRQERIAVTLKNLLPTRRETTDDPYAPLRTRRYFENMIDPVLGETPEGQAMGYWSPNWLLREARALVQSLPVVENSFANGGLFLEGRYASVNIHPDAIAKLQGLSFAPTYSSRLATTWVQTLLDGTPAWEVVPRGSFYGRPLLNAEEASQRVARRLPDHDPVSYINDGFDEIQVYYAIDRLMESLHGLGFSDPELSTRAFHAFLYDPDIGMRDNAYYTNDTINFTTYSPKALNYARDNSTIWHELGHGVMDRLMGDYLKLNDSGGLAEGMADFIAQLVIQDVTEGATFDGSRDFRIINKTGFSLTNESHDDGEAYGGAMNDILVLAIERFGREGVHKMTDLTLESMRLTRNHPGLTANDWFEHMIYADKLGREGVRAPGEMTDLIVQALQTRNFRLDRGPIADFIAKYDGEVLTDKSAGSRYNPIAHTLNGADEATHELEFQLVESEHYKFKYPVTLLVTFNEGPLQGGVKWKNEAQGPVKVLIQSAEDQPKVAVGAVAGCDFVNREDGSCSDFAYLQVFNAGDEKPFAKKRFYLQISGTPAPIPNAKPTTLEQAQ